VQMSKAEILAQAGGETSLSGSAWVRNVDYTKLSTLLSTYTSRLLAYLKANHDAKPLEEIVSSRRVVETNYGSLGDAPQIVAYSTSWSSYETWSGTAIPDTRMSKLAVIAGTGTYNTTIDQFATQLYSRTFTMPELSARKLSLSFSGNTATLAQDDVVSGPSTFTVSGTTASINLKVIHPHYTLGYSNGTYTATESGRDNQNGIATYNKSDSNHYALVRAFDNPQKLLRKRQEILDKYRRDGVAETDPRLKSEALNILGLSWYYQTWRNDRIAAGYLQILPFFHHRVGRVSQESSYYIDVFNQYYTAINRSANSAYSTCYAQVVGATQSAMEHGVIEQTEGVAGVSTARMIYVANLAHDRIFRATTSTWSAAKAQLTGYSTGTLAALEAEMTTANTVGLMTEVGNRNLNQWTGAGYAITRPDVVSMKISGGVPGGVNNGGYITEIYRQLEADTLADMIHHGPSYLPSSGNVTSVPYQISLDRWVSPTSLPATYPRSSGGSPASFTAQIVPQQASWDPVDMLSGAYLLDKKDLDSGRMAFARHYHSHLRYDDSAGLGYGWSHEHSIRLTEMSSLRAALGEVNAYQAAPQLIAALAANVVHYQNATAKEWTIAMLISHWAVEQMQANAVSITAGNRTIEFAKMPDGTFIAPPGMNLTLTKSTGTTPVYTMTERHGNTYVFNANKRISTITDPSGNVQTFSYNGSGQLTSVQDAFSHTYTYSWDNGRISGVSDGTGRSVGFGYTSGNLTSVTDPEGKIWTYQYDTEHRLLNLKDPDDRFIVQNAYDSLSRVIRQRSMGDSNRTWNFGWSGFLNLEEDPKGALTSYHYDGRGRSLGVTDALGNRASMAYDGQDRIVSQTTPKGETTTRVWNADNNPASETDPKNYTSQFFYDTQKRLERVRDKRGKDTTFTWSAAHQMLSQTDPLGHVSVLEYYPNGTLKSVTDATSKKTTFEYDTWGQVNKVTFPDGKFQSFTSNARGHLLTETDAMGRTTIHTWNKRGQLLTSTLPPVPGEPASIYTNVYDNSGNLQSSSDAKGNATSFTSNALGKAITATLPALSAGNNVLTHGYDFCDRLSAIVNSSGHSVSYEHDAAKRLTAVTDPLNRRSETAYDANSQPIRAKDPLARISEFGWSSRGEQEGHIDPLNHASGFQFDAEGNLTQFTNRRGKLSGFVYDDVGRLTSSTTPGGKTTLTTYYDNNLVKTVTEPSGQVTTLAYDNQWRVQSLTDPVGTITNTYDDSGRLLTVTGGGTTLTRTYDERGRLKTFTNADGDLIQYRYDANDNISRIVYPDGKQVNYTYNARNQLETVTDWNQRVTTYQYDRLGMLTGILRPNGTTATIGRDAAGQLKEIRESASGSLFSYLRLDYDAAGQIEGRFHAPLVHTSWQQPAFSATYDDDNRLSAANGYSVTHDSDGNMTQGPITSSSGNVSLAFNARNLLTSAGGISYTYDPEGRRRTSSDASGTTRYVIDPNGGLSRLLVKHAPDGGKTFYVYGLGLLYEVSEAETTKTYHFDQVGSTIARTNDAGALIGRAEYSAYGLAAWKNGDMDTPFLYNGQYGVMTDGNGLLYMRARYYSPYLMRFVNADPIGFGGGSNWFAYADGNPVNYNDPEGEFVNFLIGAAISAGLDYGFQVAANYARGKSGSAAWTDVNATSILISAGTGAITGGIGGAIAGKTAASGMSAATQVAVRALANGAANGAVSAAGQVARNLTDGDPRTGWSANTGNAAIFGVATGAAGSATGDAVEGTINAFRQATAIQTFRGASLARKLNAVSNAYDVPSDVGLGATVGTVIGSKISNWPINPLIKHSSSK